LVVFSSRLSRRVTGSQGNGNPRILRLFENYLANPKHMRQFKEFSVRDFTVEFPLFYQRLNTLLSRIQSPDGLDVRLYEDSVYEMWDMFIRRGARFQVRLDDGTRKDVENALEQGTMVGFEVWAKAKKDVVLVMWREVWPRYVREQREKKTLAELEVAEETEKGKVGVERVRKMCAGQGNNAVDEKETFERLGL